MRPVAILLSYTPYPVIERHHDLRIPVRAAMLPARWRKVFAIVEGDKVEEVEEPPFSLTRRPLRSSFFAVAAVTSLTLDGLVPRPKSSS
jgi:hypothetical protein